MKKFLLLLLMPFTLVSCQAKSTPRPEIREVTRILEQTVEVPHVIKETVLVAATTEVSTPIPTKFWEGDYKLPPEYFDGIVILVQHYTFWQTKQCEYYYDTFSEWGKSQNSKDAQLDFCLNPNESIELVSVMPYNYLLESRGEIRIQEPEDMLFFEVIFENTLVSTHGDKNMRLVRVWQSVVLEDGEWKIGLGSTTPPKYGDQYWNK